MANVTLGADGSINGIFAQPQPHLDGFAVIADDDPRIAVFFRADPASVAHDMIMAQIAALEATQTPRRIREAATTPAGAAWLLALDGQMSALRGQLQAPKPT